MRKYKVLKGDCLKLMETIRDASVDLIFADLPYAQTTNSWDIIIPFEPLWEQYKRIGKPNCCFLFTAKGQFMIDLINSNREWYRYEWIWNKKKGANFASANKRPLMVHEFVLVFYKNAPTYNPQMTLGKPYVAKRPPNSCGGIAEAMSKEHTTVCDGRRYPNSIIEVHGHSQKGLVHPTQKPIALLDYLIKTYSNKGDLVLDNCMGSGTTGVSALTNGRRFMGIEQEDEYFKIAKNRLKSVASTPKLW